LELGRGGFLGGCLIRREVVGRQRRRRSGSSFVRQVVVGMAGREDLVASGGYGRK
jgi:hypothetical protein